MRIFVLFCFCLLHAVAAAQTAVSGRVLDAKSGDGLPGVTILQSGTTNGVSSDVDGYFTFSVSGTPDSVALAVSSIGYATQQLRVAAGSNTVFRLVQDTRNIIECPVMVHPRVEVGLLSGVRYAPFGGTLKLVGNRLVRLPITATIGYQTNFGGNYVLRASLDLPPIRQSHVLSFTEGLAYQQVRTGMAATRFDSYSALVGIDVGKIGLPSLLLGTGYARYLAPATDQALSTVGYGYTAGLRFSLLPYPLYDCSAFRREAAREGNGVTPYP